MLRALGGAAPRTSLWSNGLVRHFVAHLLKTGENMHIQAAGVRAGKAGSAAVCSAGVGKRMAVREKAISVSAGVGGALPQVVEGGGRMQEASRITEIEGFRSRSWRVS